MGAGEESTPTKSSKPASSAQETPITPTTPAYPDWSSSMQAFYGAGATPPFFASTVASPTPHPYLWGSQHPLMPPYGTPVHISLISSWGSSLVLHNFLVFANNCGPKLPKNHIYLYYLLFTGSKCCTWNWRIGWETHREEGPCFKQKNQGASGNHVMIGGKTGDAKATSGTGDDVGTQSAESGSEGSSDASDDDNNQVVFLACTAFSFFFPRSSIEEFMKTSAAKKGSFDQMLADGANAQNNGVPTNFQTSVPGNPVVSVPATNLNIGMDLWNASPAGSGAMKLRPNQPGVSPTIAPPGMINDQWIQDERELKRQKRKQSNRESARRSRLRKQAECEELQHRVETLSNENHTLRDELQRLSEECEKLTSENNSIKEELTKLCGPDVLSKLENSNGTHLQSRGDEGNC
ncbi:G-box-binding factor 1 [Sesamum angolense]|uniref:G-box-binding factor 1 n=1 Tax=Sesamum angolense TaxID=2727404 RepID=A0AAE1XE44_9LAMI|nr:G-box-binding factor 1 [Sesamum angolense]